MTHETSRRRFLSNWAVLSLFPSHSSSASNTGAEVGDIPWKTPLENFRPTSVLETADGNYLFTGTGVEQFGDEDWEFFGVSRIVELTPAGAVEWSDTFYEQTIMDGTRTPHFDEHFRFNDIIATADGGYLCIGQYDDTNYGYRLGWLVKLDAHREFEWETFVGWEQASSAMDVFGDCFFTTGFQRDTGYLLAGGCIPEGSTVDDPTDGWLLDVSEDGERRRDVLESDVLSFSSLDLFDGIIFCGARRDTATHQGALVGYDELPSNGWSHWYPTTGRISSLVRSEMGLLLVGSTGGAGWVAKRDTELQSVWERIYSPWEYAIEFTAAIAAPDGYLLIGSADGFDHAWTIRIDDEGGRKDARRYETLNGDFTTGTRMHDGGLLLGGDDGEFDGDGWIIKLRADEQPDFPHELVIESTAEQRAFYGVTVTGNITYGERANPEATADYPDRIQGNIARGAVALYGTDNFYFSGDVTDLRVKGPVKIELGGTQVTPAEINDEPLVHTVTIESTSEERAFYEFSVDGSLQYGANANPVEAEYPDRITGRTASGSVALFGTDDFHFSGTISDFELDGPAQVLIDGGDVDPSEYSIESHRDSVR